MASVYTVLEYLGQDVKIPDNYSHFIDLHSNLLLCFKSFFLFLLQFEISFSPEIFILQSSRGSRPGCRRWYRPLYVCVCGLHFFYILFCIFPISLKIKARLSKVMSAIADVCLFFPLRPPYWPHLESVHDQGSIITLLCLLKKWNYQLRFVLFCGCLCWYSMSW